MTLGALKFCENSFGVVRLMFHTFGVVVGTLAPRTKPQHHSTSIYWAGRDLYGFITCPEPLGLV